MRTCSRSRVTDRSRTEKLLVSLKHGRPEGGTTHMTALTCSSVPVRSAPAKAGALPRTCASWLRRADALPTVGGSWALTPGTAVPVMLSSSVPAFTCAIMSPPTTRATPPVYGSTWSNLQGAGATPCTGRWVQHTTKRELLTRSHVRDPWLPALLTGETSSKPPQLRDSPCGYL